MNDNQNTIQWFPGHMAKTRRMIGEMLPLIDLVAEVIDARIPVSSRNPELGGWIGQKPRIILLNKCDMADERRTEEWIGALNDETTVAIPIDCKSGRGLDKFLPAVRRILEPQRRKYEAKGMSGRTLRVMAAGIPNVGKSSFINRLCGQRRAKVANRPGVTRGNQWFMIDKGIELLDTPGVLWPKFEDKAVGEHLAFCGSIKDSILDIETLAVDLIACLRADYPALFCERFKLADISDLQNYEVLELIAVRRGMKISRGEADTERAAATLLEEFRNCKIGKMTLERVDGN